MEPKLKKLCITIIILLILGISFTIYRNIKAKEKYNLKIEEMRMALQTFAKNNPEYLPEKEKESITLTLRTLKYFDLISQNIQNPFTRKRFSNNLLFTITKTKEGYQYQVWDKEKIKKDYDDINTNAPFIILKGNRKEKVEINSNYEDMGYITGTKKGLDADEMEYEIKEKNKSVSKVDTSKLTTYEITYLASYAKEQTYITRTVEIVDTKAPTITMDKVELKASEVENYNLLNGVTIEDNSKQKVTVTYSGELSSIPGKYIITYKAVDQQGNKREKKRVIRVE